MPVYTGSLPDSIKPEAMPRAQEWCDTTVATGTVAIKPQPGMLYGISVAGAGAVAVTIYDNASAASGKVLWAGTPGPGGGFFPCVPIIARLGITVAAGAATVNVYWS